MNKKLFDKAKGIKLDVASGLNKHKGCVGMDIVPHPNVDIVHDIQKMPWPVPASVCHKIYLAHIWEHIEPKYRFPLMDELWRVCRHDGQVFISCPYAHTFLAAAHPAHYMCPNEATFTFFDPAYVLYNVTAYKKPKPWKITYLNWNVGGCIEIIMEPRKNERGRPVMPVKDEVKIEDVVQVGIVDKADKKRDRGESESKTSDSNSDVGDNKA